MVGMEHLTDREFVGHDFTDSDLPNCIVERHFPNVTVGEP
jgi:hypothetical protein